MRKIVPFILSLCLVLSCSEGRLKVDNSLNDPLTRDGSLRIIPKEQALKTLQDFLAGENFPATRSVTTNDSYSIETYYNNDNLSTRSEDIIPDAYIVNFSDNNGFAVLGANSSVPEIVAVIERGSISATDLSISDSSNSEPESDSLSSFISELIKVGLTADPEIKTRTNTSYNTCPRLLTYSWNQGKVDIQDAYNKYCYRTNIIGDVKYAYTGCSTTAMAMIVTYNEFPTTLTLNGLTIDWPEMKTAYSANNLSADGKEYVSRLMGSIFNAVDKVVNPGSTLITPEQIKKRMEDFGYLNVEKWSNSIFSPGMINKASEMLGDRKPVFMSAIPKKWGNAHSWVIDGAKYSGETYCFHFNFGWSGLCNGYFATNCLNPGKGVEYDSSRADNTSSEMDYTYTWHFRMLAYDIPTYDWFVSLGFTY